MERGWVLIELVSYSQAAIIGVYVIIFGLGEFPRAVWSPSAMECVADVFSFNSDRPAWYEIFNLPSRVDGVLHGGATSERETPADRFPQSSRSRRRSGATLRSCSRSSAVASVRPPLSLMPHVEPSAN